MFNKSILPMVGLFLVIAICTIVLRNTLEQNGVNWQVIMGGNIFLYVVSVISFNLLRESINAATTAAFLRRAYASILLKLFGCAIAALAYIMLSGSKLNKPALFSLMGLYLVYTYIEMKELMNHVKRQKNAGS